MTALRDKLKEKTAQAKETEAKYKQLESKFKRWCKSHENHEFAATFHNKGPKISEATRGTRAPPD